MKWEEYVQKVEAQVNDAPVEMVELRTTYIQSAYLFIEYYCAWKGDRLNKRSSTTLLDERREGMVKGLGLMARLLAIVDGFRTHALPTLQSWEGTFKSLAESLNDYEEAPTHRNARNLFVEAAKLSDVPMAEVLESDAKRMGW